MTRPEDVWAPPRADRVTTIRFGTVSATPAAGVADVTVIGGQALTGVPVYGSNAVGTPVLLFLDGEKVVGVADPPPVTRYGAVVTGLADGTFSLPLPGGLFASTPIAVATVQSDNATVVAVATITGVSTSLVTGKVAYMLTSGGGWATAPGFLIHVAVSPRNLTATEKPA